MEDTKPKAFVFVLMPFAESFKDIYEVGIKPACKDAGAYCERADEQHFDENILEWVFNQIGKADIVVAELTGCNPNVFYETGYAHALNKRVVLLTQKAEDIPFDLTHFPHIVYGGSIARLKTQLEARIRWCIENPKESLAAADVPLEAFVNGTSLTDRPSLNIGWHSTMTYEFVDLEIQLHSLCREPLAPGSFAGGLVVPDECRSVWKPEVVEVGNEIVRDLKCVVLPDKRRLCHLPHDEVVFPDSWLSWTIRLGLRFVKARQLEMVLRVFTKMGPKDFPFTLDVSEKDKA